MIKSVNEANLAEDTFYGFKLDNLGGLEVHVIDDDSMIVTLEEDNDNILTQDDYKHSVWANDYLDFFFNGNNGHLLMKVI